METIFQKSIKNELFQVNRQEKLLHERSLGNHGDHLNNGFLLRTKSMAAGGQERYEEFKNEVMGLGFLKEEIRFKDVQGIVDKEPLWFMSKKTISKYLRKMIEEELISKHISSDTHKPVYELTSNGLDTYFKKDVLKYRDKIVSDFNLKFENLETRSLFSTVESFYDTFLVSYYNTWYNTKNDVKNMVDQTLEKYILEKRIEEKTIKTIRDRLVENFTKKRFEELNGAICILLTDTLTKVTEELLRRQDFNEKSERFIKGKKNKMISKYRRILKLAEKNPELQESPYFLKIMTLLKETFPEVTDSP